MSTWGPALLSSGVVAAVIPLLIAIMNRRQTKALALQAEAMAKKTDSDRESTLADAAGKWAQLLDRNRQEAFAEVEQRCQRCEDALADRDVAIDALIDAVTELIPLVPADAEETEAVRAAIRTARRSRHH